MTTPRQRADRVIEAFAGFHFDKFQLRDRIEDEIREAGDDGHLRGMEDARGILGAPLSEKDLEDIRTWVAAKVLSHKAIIHKLVGHIDYCHALFRDMMADVPAYERGVQAGLTLAAGIAGEFLAVARANAGVKDRLIHELIHKYDCVGCDLPELIELVRDRRKT